MTDRHLPRTTGPARGTAFDYVLCGWHTRSDLPLTAVPTQLRAGENVDVRIETAQGASPMAACAQPYVFEHSAARSLIKIGEIAEFEVSEGRLIRVWLAPGVERKDAEIFLLDRPCVHPCGSKIVLEDEFQQFPELIRRLRRIIKSPPQADREHRPGQRVAHSALNCNTQRGEPRRQ